MTNSTSYSISDVAKHAGGRLCGSPDNYTRIRFLLCDSRQLLLPQDTLFFALRTKKNDGHHYVEELLKKGVRCFVVEKVRDAWLTAYPEAAFVVHEHPLAALQMLAAAHRTSFSIPLLAITGSNGKTVVKEWLSQLLAREKRIVRNPKSYNSQIGVPLSVWLISPQHQLGVFEAGISQPGEMKKLQRILQPDTGILTNIGSAHDEGFTSRREKIWEKLLLFVSCQSLVYCRDQQFVHDELTVWVKQHPEVRPFSWGGNQEADVCILNRQKSDNNTRVTLRYKTRQFSVCVPFHDDASVENAMHCIAYLLKSGYAPEFIAENIPSLQAVAMRLEMKEGVNGSTVINDSYNSDLQSLAIALDFQENQTRHQRKTLILSDILQSGIPGNELYAQVADLVNARKPDRLIGIGREISTHAGKFTVPALFFETTDAFIASFDVTGFKEESILLKGARKFGFERLSSLLQQKDHQTVLEIDLDGLTHNLNVFRSLITADTRTMCMVKAFSYGSGSVEVARMLQFHQVDCLAVAYADEGKELRRGGIDIPIVVMNPEIRTFDILFHYRLEPEVYGFPLLERLIKAVDHHKEHLQTGGFRVHIKLDTGMHRLGFLPEEVTELCNVLVRHPYIRVASVFTHMAASEDRQHDAFSAAQIRLFASLCEIIENKLGYSFLRHMANSAAISRFPEAHFDMVRPGIGLYGVSGDPSVQQLLQHVSTFRSVVSQVKRIKKGDAIGYGRQAIATGDMTVAIVPVGYADGLNRRLGNGRGNLLVNGQKVPTVGNISMDMCAIDVTGLKVREGDDVIIFGKDLPVTEVAEALGTIPYEVLTSVSQRVKRIYYQS
ncbi:MAG: bifunctional UDP-N-acetylmuramoyl-tripeptide:D-alanyl-D-alanine ligase/alanine racemase [Bacteroidales bacterium]|nr:bifunctional UDP-N-acetylmuramoyl-tripeptide:D-alanyl-D-alanine ligase/alanine racemase [Bacteroidales bacterium]